MNASSKTRVLMVFGLALMVVLVLASSGLAQCAMCRASLAGSNNAFFIRNFNIGVLVLLTPPVAIFCSIFIVLKRHSREQRATDTTDTDQNHNPEIN
jgi:hypothetical protein